LVPDDEGKRYGCATWSYFAGWQGVQNASVTVLSPSVPIGKLPLTVIAEYGNRLRIREFMANKGINGEYGN
jgi:hypothetical protein